MKYKQVIVVREDLDMSRGKIASQVAHASLLAFLESEKKNKQIVDLWLKEGGKKVVLKVKNLKELMNIFEKACENNLVCVIIKDAGLTEIPSGEITCIGIGPDEEEKIDQVTGHLPLLK